MNTIKVNGSMTQLAREQGDYSPKGRIKPIPLRITESQYTEHRNNYDGYCIACGEIQFGGCEPDAEKYRCEACGERTVYGIEMLIFTGNLDLIYAEDK